MDTTVDDVKNDLILFSVGFANLTSGSEMLIEETMDYVAPNKAPLFKSRKHSLAEYFNCGTEEMLGLTRQSCFGAYRRQIGGSLKVDTKSWNQVKTWISRDNNHQYSISYKFIFYSNWLQ